MSQLGTQKQPKDLQLLFGEGHGLAKFDQCHAMLGSEGPQYVRLDQVVKGQLQRLAACRLYQRAKGGARIPLGIVATNQPRS